MNMRSIAIIGLPESGKTTFLAALWHLITERDETTKLVFDTLVDGDWGHLNKIAARWRDAKVQDRTSIDGTRLVRMNLKDVNGDPVRITFPDVPGEAYRQMWEERTCDNEMSEILGEGDVIFFVHADTIKTPRWVVDEVAQSERAGLEAPNDDLVPWSPHLAPTQVQVVDLLEVLRLPPIDTGPRRLAIVLSAWDKADGEGLTPAEYLTEKLPLLDQYLRGAADSWKWRTYGVSAQGGDYDSIDPNKEKKPEAEDLRNMDRPSTRVQVVAEGLSSHDLTEPIAWLID